MSFSKANTVSFVDNLVQRVPPVSTKGDCSQIYKQSRLIKVRRQNCRTRLAVEMKRIDATKGLTLYFEILSLHTWHFMWANCMVRRIRENKTSHEAPAILSNQVRLANPRPARLANMSKQWRFIGARLPHIWSQTSQEFMTTTMIPTLTRPRIRKRQKYASS